MRPWARAVIAALLLIAGVLAQDVVPTWVGFHTWQYALLLVVLALWPLGYMGFARKGGDGEFGVRLSVALVGAALIGTAGLASGLLGPDSATFTRAPGTVLPLPDLAVAAFFPNADAASIAGGEAGLVLRRRGSPEIAVLPHSRRFLGSYALELRPRHAAYVEARDERGDHLTVTQPTSSTFLSPVLLFPANVPIGGQMLPSDSFSVPALHRRVQAMYFSPAAVRGTRAGRGIGDHAAVLFAVEDDAGRVLPGGIALGALGNEVRPADLRLRATVGAYPELVVSAVPSMPALCLGCLWLAAASVWAWRARAKAGLAL